MREKARDTDWASAENGDVNTHANNITDLITQLADSNIPNKIVRIRPSDPPWINNNIRKHIRKRKRAFQKAKQTDSDDHWTAYKRLRNDTLSLIRSARKSYDDKLSDSLGDRTLQSKDWWKTLKCFITPDKPKADIPPLYNNGHYLSDGK